MTRYLVLVLFICSCQDYASDRIAIPGEMPISGQGILDQIMKKSENDPGNERLLLQQLYYCQELGWPKPCDQSLLKAKKHWGLTDKLVDQMIAYHLAHGNVDELDAILTGAIETRSRLEAKIEIGTKKNRDISSFLARYLDHYDDEESAAFALNHSMNLGDTSQSLLLFETLYQFNPTHEKLREYHPVLFVNNNYDKAIEVIENQLFINPNDTTLLLNLGIALYKIGNGDSAKVVLRNLNTERGNAQIADWYKLDENWDSTLFYVDKLLVKQPNDRAVLLMKAEALEARRWITRSLPYYERVLSMDTTDIDMANRVEIVRRKVAYLRQLRESKRPAPIPNLERKTTTDN